MLSWKYSATPAEIKKPAMNDFAIAFSLRAFLHFIADMHDPGLAVVAYDQDGNEWDPPVTMGGAAHPLSELLSSFFKIYSTAKLTAEGNLENT